jgi:hypothetical protein
MGPQDKLILTLDSSLTLYYAGLFAGGRLNIVFGSKVLLLSLEMSLRYFVAAALIKYLM